MDSNKINELQKIIDEKNLEIQNLTRSLGEERRKFENELQVIHEYYENIIALMPGHVYWLDKNNVFLGCNDLQAQSAQLKSRKDIVGKTNYDMPWKDQAEELNKVNTLVMETGIPHTTEEYAVMANGMGIYYSHKVPLRNQKNETIGVLGISLNITERKKMEVALRRAKEKAEVANQAKTEFIANMSHDFHTPLSGIVGMSKLLEEKAQDPEKKQYARWIHESGEQLLELLNGVMEIVATDNLREDDVHEELFELRKNIQDIVHLVQPTSQMKKIQLNIEIDDKAPKTLITDATKIHRVLLNLIGNAIKFTNNGTVTIRVEVLSLENNYAQLKFSIIDTGIGIPPELQTKIFDRFFRANTHGGYGMGLHIAQKYLSLLGGEIHLESAVDKGSTFHFTLTMKIDYNEQATPIACEANPNDNKSSLSPLILLVENNILSLHLIEHVVEKAGYEFYSAIDGEHALELIATNDFDLIIADLGLANRQENRFLLNIRKLEAQMHKKPTPIVGLATNPPQYPDEEYSRLGMSKIIAKPFHLKALQEVIDDLVHNH